MPNQLRVAYLTALKHSLRATMSVLRLTRPLIPESVRKKLRGQHRSMDVKFSFAPLNILDQEIAKAKGENYLQWYARYKNENTEPMDGSESPAAKAYLASGAKDLEICKSLGLLPHHRFHEFATGRGRCTQFFVPYLDVGKYSGNDASSGQVDLCKHLLNTLGVLETKKPRFIVNPDNSMDWMNGEKVDYIYNYAVIVHVPPEDAEEIIANTKRLMHAKTSFLCNYTENESRTMERYTHKDWLYSPDFFTRIAAKNGYKITDVSDRLPPPYIPPGYPKHYQRLLNFTLA